MELDLSIIIPVYNAEDTINPLVLDINECLKDKNISYEIVIVNDHSRDNSWAEIKKLKEQFSFIKALSLSKNFGQHKATLCGFSNSKGKVIVTIDDDFEQKTSDILVLYNELIFKNVDLVYGIPANIKKSPLRLLLTWFYKKLSQLIVKEACHGSSFRALKQSLVTKIINHNNHLFFVDELVLWYTSSISMLPVNYNPSKKTTSGYSIKSLFSLSANVLVMSTVFPLKFVKTVGIIISSISFIIGIHYLIQKFTGNAPEGYISIIVSILFSTGAILFCIAVIGEYIGNLLFLQNHKPGYVVKEEL